MFAKIVNVCPDSLLVYCFQWRKWLCQFGDGGMKRLVN